MKKTHYLRPDTFIVKVEAQAMLAGSGDNSTIVTPASEGYGFFEETFKDATTAFGDGSSLWTTDDDNEYDFTDF